MPPLTLADIQAAQRRMEDIIARATTATAPAPPEGAPATPLNTNLDLAGLQRLRNLLVVDAPPAAPEGALEAVDEFTAPAPTMAERERLRRQESLNLRLPRGVAIIGCGGVGSWIALMLALAGVQNLWLFDHDTVSEHNLNRLPLPPSAVNVGKSEALAQMLKVFRPSCAPTPLKSFSFETARAIGLDNEVGWLVCSTDTWASRKEAKAWADETSIRYIEAAAEGEMGSITDAPAEWATDQETQPGYQSVPVWVGPCVAAAMMAVAHVIHDTRPTPDLALRMGWSENGIEFFDSGALLRGVPPRVPPLTVALRDNRWRIDHPVNGTLDGNGAVTQTAPTYEFRRPAPRIHGVAEPPHTPFNGAVGGTDPAPAPETWIVEVQSRGSTRWSQSRNRATSGMYNSEAAALAAIATRPHSTQLTYRARLIP